MSGFTASPPNQALPLRNVTDVMLNSTTAINTTVLTGVSYAPMHPCVLIAFPIIILVGLVGNTLSIRIMAPMCKSPFFLYLTVVAIADSVFLLVEGLASWLAVSGIYNPFKSLVHHTCSVTNTCAVISSELSAWVIVAVTIDRYIAVCHPLKVVKYCTLKRAAVTMGVIFLFLVGINFPCICFEWNDDYTQCLFPYNICQEYAFVTITILYMSLPGVLIAFFNILIIRGLFKAYRRRRTLTGDQETTVASKAHEYARRTTIMLLSVTCVYLPSLLLFVHLCIVVFMDHMTIEDTGKSHLYLITSSRMCVLVNHSVNFFLYGLTGTTFREKLVDLCRIRRKANRNSSRAEPHSDNQRKGDCSTGTEYACYNIDVNTVTVAVQSKTD